MDVLTRTRRPNTGRSVHLSTRISIPCCKPLSDVLSELHRSQESAYNLRDAGRQDYLTRAKICSKIMKYPHLDDYAVRVIHGTPLLLVLLTVLSSSR